MPDPDVPPQTVPPPAADAVLPSPVPAASPATGSARRLRHTLATLALLGVLCVAALVLAWQAKERVRSLEQELVRRQQETQAQAVEARSLSRQAEEGSRAAAAKVALLEARVAEVAVQRAQIEELIQALSRSRDENLLIDVESAVRMAQQQSVLTGSTEPLIVTLRQTDERLARHNEPRLERVRRAVARDIDRVRAVAVADTSTLGIKLDEVVRLVDELPLAGQPQLRGDDPDGAMPARAASPAASAASAVGATLPDWLRPTATAAAAFSARVWGEVKSLVRVTRIEHPEAVLVAPEQAFFLRENLKLRLLNARLALLARQFETAQGDLRAAQKALDRYFDRNARRTVLAAELLRQVAGQARETSVPRPDDTLAALAAAAAGR